MKIANVLKSGLVAVALGSLLLTGCQPAKTKIAVGKVDTAELLKDDPDYQSLSIDYLKEQTDARKEIVKKLEAAQGNEAKMEALQKEWMEKQQSFNKKWETKTVDFLKSRHESIRDTAAKIAERKNIDMVIVDSAEYPTVEWGGVDMTKDMALALSENSSDKPASTATPEGEAE